MTKTVAYTYDAFNRWIGETISVPGGSTEQTVYVHDGDQIVAQFDKTGVGDFAASDLSHRYAWNSQAVDQLFADERVQYDSQQGKSVTDEVLWTLVDHQNTVRDAVTYDAAADESTIRIHRTFDAYGTMTDEQLYDADGDSVSAGDPGALSELFAYTGRPFDTATQLQNNLNRWYESVTGKWLSVDPIGFSAGDTNLYRYCGNNPTNWIDPTGLDTYVQGRLIGNSSGTTGVKGDLVPTHEFVVTIDEHGQVHTYSWGNELNDADNPSHWYYDRPEDIAAGEHGTRGGIKGKPVGDGSLDPFIDEAFGLLHDAGADSPSAHSHGGVRNNCKTEAKRLISLAKGLRAAANAKTPEERERLRIQAFADVGLGPTVEMPGQSKQHGRESTAPEWNNH